MNRYTSTAALQISCHAQLAFVQALATASCRRQATHRHRRGIRHGFEMRPGLTAHGSYMTEQELREPVETVNWSSAGTVFCTGTRTDAVDAVKSAC